MENRSGFFELCWAAQRSGLYYTPISTHLKGEEIAYIVGNCQARVFIVPEHSAERPAEPTDQLPATTRLSVCGSAILPATSPLKRSPMVCR